MGGQPGAGVGPGSESQRAGQVQGLGCLLDRQPAIEAGEDPCLISIPGVRCFDRNANENGPRTENRRLTRFVIAPGSGVVDEPGGPSGA